MSTPDHVALIQAQVTARPAEHHLQRLLLVAADDLADEARNKRLSVLVRTPNLARETYAALVVDRDPGIRAQAWKFGRWTEEELRGLFAVERSAVVRRSLVEIRGLAPDMYETAALPVRSRQAARNILDWASSLPGTVVSAALTKLADTPPPRQEPTYRAYRNALNVPGVPISVCSNPAAAPWLALLAASFQEVDSETVHALFSTFLADGVEFDGESFFAAHDDLEPRKLALAIARRPDLEWRSLSALQQWLQPGYRHETLDKAVSDAAADPAERARAKWFASTTSQAADIGKFWQCLSAEERGPEVARLVMGHAYCSHDVFAEARAVYEADMGPIDPADIAAGPQETPQRWLAAFPDLLIDRIRRSSMPRSVRDVLHVLPDSAEDVVYQDLVDRIVSDILENPHEWPPGLLVDLAGRRCLPSPSLVPLLPAAALVAASTAGCTTASDLLVAELARVEVPDRGDTALRAAALPAMLACSEATLTAQLDALDLAMGLTPHPDTVPA